ncbi:MAG: hypothetical protein R2762_24585 [Bryobacteraceae bacterium]
MHTRYRFTAALLGAALAATAGTVAVDLGTVAAPTGQTQPSRPLQPVSTGPSLALRVGIAAPTPAAATTPAKPLDMKLLVIAADGQEPALPAIREFLETVGIPYDAIVAKTQPLPTLSNATKGFYQGIVLTSGNLAVQDAAGNWVSALSPASWTALDNYTRDYRVRTVAMYAFPEPRYGLTFISSVSPSETAPVWASIPAAGQAVFPYVNAANPLKVIWAFTYLSAPAPAAGETTTPVVTINGQTAGALHTKADGREYLALTFDQSPYLTHSLVLNYGLINWVTRGVFLGSRQVYMSPQNDDLFLPNSLFVDNIPGCRPVINADLTYDPATDCPSLRITGADLDKLAAWQNAIRSDPQTRNFRVTHAFNGFGATAAGDSDANDSLVLRAKALRNDFFWVSHTFDHENLDCYLPVPNSGICRPATYNEARAEVVQNVSVATTLGIPVDRQSMVTPAISGLTNPNFMRAAADNRIRYLVGDMSRPEHVPAIANTLLRSSVDSRIYIIPRRATNVFYNATTPNAGAHGSETDEYNYLFGPNGLFRIGGPGGAPFFETNQTYAQIVDRESDALVSYMFRYELYPSMYHQANFFHYDNQHSLFTDVIEAAFAKFKKISNLPVSSLAQTTIGSTLLDRMTYLGAGVRGTYTPGVGVTLTAQSTAYVPLTGVCSTGCASYGGQNQSRVLVRAGTTVTVPAP